MADEIFLMWGPGSKTIKLRDAVKARADASYKVHVLRDEQLPTGETNESAPTEGSYFATIENMLRGCVGGVAIIGAEEEKVTSRGNVWSEWGYLVATKSDHSLVTVIIPAETTAADFAHFAEDFGHFGADCFVFSLKDAEERAEELAEGIVAKLSDLIAKRRATHL